jgi:hypothetical protein
MATQKLINVLVKTKINFELSQAVAATINLSFKKKMREKQDTSSISKKILYSDLYFPAGCGILQYADDMVVFASHKIMEIARALVQTACSALSTVKSEAMVFSRKHHKPDVTLWIHGRSLPQTKEFKYFGVFFDSGLRWSTQVRNVQRRRLQRLNFMRSIAGT